MSADRATRRSLLRAGLLRAGLLSAAVAAVLTVVCASPAVAAASMAADGGSAEHPVLSLLTGLVLGVLGGAGAIAWHRSRL